MPNFQYEAVNAAGKAQKGVIEANSAEDAQTQLKAQGYFPTSVAEKKGRSGKREKAAKPAKKKGRGFSISIGGINLKKMTTFEKWSVRHTS